MFSIDCKHVQVVRLIFATLIKVINLNSLQVCALISVGKLISFLCENLRLASANKAYF